MTNFNSINNNPVPFQNISQKKAEIVKEQNNQNSNQNTNNVLTNQNELKGTKINPSLVYDYKMAKMDTEVVLKYLQNLLNLPNSINKFVNQLINSKNPNPEIVKILVENMINAKALGEFLNQNSQVAISKLMQTISNSLQTGINDVSQLKEILGFLTSIQNSTNINSNTIKEFLLLYIPLNVPVFDKQMDTSSLEEIENEKIKNSKLSLLIETINFSNMLCCLNQDSNNLFVEVFANKFFPKEHFSKIISILSKEANINSMLEFKESKNDNETRNQNFKVISTGFIPTDILILSQIVIQTIFKIDNDFTTT